MTLIASHRGGTHLWPENSRRAFMETAKLAVDYVEFDVHQTLDTVLVVHHDATLDRTTDGKGPLGALSFEALRRHVLIAAGGESVPTLDEVLAIMAPSPVDLRLEIKQGVDGVPYAGMEARIVAALSRDGLIGRTLLTSFALERLSAFVRELRAVGHEVAQLRGLMWLVSPVVVDLAGLKGVAAAAKAYGVTEIGLQARQIDAEVMAFFAAEGITLHGWSAHTVAAAEKMFALGVASFTTDRPDLAIAVRDGRKG